MPSFICRVIIWALLGALVISGAHAVASNYDRSLRVVLLSEGGFSNFPADPGGRTLHGITQRVYDSFRRSKGLPRKLLTRAMLRDPAWHRERDEIYRRRYANPVQFDALPLGLDFAIFDYAVNSGVGRAGKVLRRSVGFPDGNGKVTDDVIAELNTRDTATMIRWIWAERLRFFHSIIAGRPASRVFLRGWTNRVRTGLATSLAMHAGKTGGGSEQYPAWGPGKAYENGPEDDDESED